MARPAQMTPCPRCGEPVGVSLAGMLTGKAACGGCGNLWADFGLEDKDGERLIRLPMMRPALPTLIAIMAVVGTILGMLASALVQEKAVGAPVFVAFGVGLIVAVVGIHIAMAMLPATRLRLTLSRIEITRVTGEAAPPVSLAVVMPSLVTATWRRRPVLGAWATLTVGDQSLRLGDGLPGERLQALCEAINSYYRAVAERHAERVPAEAAAARAEDELGERHEAALNDEPPVADGHPELTAIHLRIEELGDELVITQAVPSRLWPVFALLGATGTVLAAMNHVWIGAALALAAGTAVTWFTGGVTAVRIGPETIEVWRCLAGKALIGRRLALGAVRDLATGFGGHTWLLTDGWPCPLFRFASHDRREALLILLGRRLARHGWRRRFGYQVQKGKDGEVTIRLLPNGLGGILDALSPAALALLIFSPFVVPLAVLLLVMLPLSLLMDDPPDWIFSVGLVLLFAAEGYLLYRLGKAGGSLEFSRAGGRRLVIRRQIGRWAEKLATFDLEKQSLRRVVKMSAGGTWALELRHGMDRVTVGTGFTQADVASIEQQVKAADDAGDAGEAEPTRD